MMLILSGKPLARLRIFTENLSIHLLMAYVPPELSRRFSREPFKNPIELR
jgi:hypothetical protein